MAKVIKQTLEFSQCYDYGLEQGEVVDVSDKVSFLPHESSYLLCKGEQKAIPILITNNENFGNRYILVFDGPEFASLNIDKVQLDGNKAGIFLINYDTTDVEGEFDFNLNAISELGKVQKKKSFEVNVEDCLI